LPFADSIAAFAELAYIRMIKPGGPEVPRAKAKREPGIPTGFAEEERPFVHDEIVRGVAAKRVKALIDRGVLGAKQVYRVIPERTFGRRLAKGEALKPAEADAIGRLIRVTEEAEKTFGDADFAHKWLIYPNPALGDRIPIEMAETDAGAREVETILTRIAYGVYS
jgi:putative toxin-antitoxin system antitoxin component (TIGR02293 family)